MVQKNFLVFSVFVIIFASSVFFLGYYSSQITDDSTSEVTIRIIAKQFDYEPENITVSFGTRVHLILTSIDVTHGFQIEEYNINNIQIRNGEETEVSFVANLRGEFTFFCDVFCGVGHADHWGRLIVV